MKLLILGKSINTNNNFNSFLIFFLGCFITLILQFSGVESQLKPDEKCFELFEECRPNSDMICVRQNNGELFLINRCFQVFLLCHKIIYSDMEVVYKGHCEKSARKVRKNKNIFQNLLTSQK